LFVTWAKFTEEEFKAYNLLRSIIFDKDITSYTTIVWTGFVNFENEEECVEEIQKLNKENPKIVNPSIPINGRSNFR